MIRNLGRALTIIAEAHATEHAFYEDLAAFHAPSECYRDVSKGEGRRLRRARRHAEGVAGAKMRLIEKEAAARGLPIGSPRWDALLGRLIAKHSPH